MKPTTAFLVSCFFIIMVGCSNEQTVKAQIFERKQIDSNQLMIKYQYSIKQQQFIDSTTIDNVVLHHDTIDIKVDNDNPAKSSPDLKK
jgi:hypothetical protein